MKTILKYAIPLVILAGILGSCSPRSRAARHLKKAERHLKIAEQLGAKVDADTLWKTLEIPVPMVKTDTVFRSRQGDTVIIQKDRLRIKYVNLPKDSVFIEGECQADTIVKRIPVKVYKKISAGYTLWKLIILAIAALAVGYIVRTVVFMIRSK